MEAEKRKRGDDDEKIDGKRRRTPTIDDDEKTVTDDEVDEFFAILKRIHVAVKYLKKDNGDGSKLNRKRWTPSFELSDFNDAVDGGGKRENVPVKEKVSGLDLKSDPTPSKGKIV